MHGRKELGCLRKHLRGKTVFLVDAAWKNWAVGRNI
jgi:hypothetical protein